MTTVLLLLCHLLPFSHSAPEPDTHLHVYLPPEGEKGSFFLSLLVSHVFLLLLGAKTPNTGGGSVNNGLR